MKKLLLPLLLLCFSISFSQEITDDPNLDSEEVFKRDTAKNELSIGTFNLVVFGALDLAYERILTPHSSWAVEGFVLALDRDSEDVGDAFTKDFSLTGKYKYFFSERRTAWGFYVNGFAMVSSGEYYKYREIYNDGYYQSERDYNNYTDLALGFGLGGKFVSKQGFFLDLNAGIGRNLFNDNSPTIVGQFNVNLGFRF
ncbi:hypothetical protein [Gillisia sp. Hel_I_29]|uniref:hypothetical protein n=1 Tax=Gillisia sp. Hel_I_29 TaxID=1249975 RepID=UPI000557E11A|nr:hypothetical protein [Gillisia sp. Hel_I_29]